MSLVDTMHMLRRFAQAMSPSVPPVDLALSPLRALFDAAGIAYRLVGGAAVIHHGYVRSTVDLDVLIPARVEAVLDPLLERFGFERVSRTRLRHVVSGVQVDLLIAGDPIPRREAVYPDPASVAPSPRDPGVIGLAGLLTLKLRAGRRQDEADVIRLLERLSHSDFLVIEGAVERELRPDLALLWDDAQEELAWERADEEGR